MKKKPMLNRSSSWPVANKPAIWDMTYRHMSNGKRIKYKSYDTEDHHYYCVYPVLDKKNGQIYLVGRNGGSTFEGAIAFMDARIKQVIRDVESWHPQPFLVGSPEHDEFIAKNTMEMALEDERIRLEEEAEYVEHREGE